MRQNGPKTITYDITQKNTATPNQKFFFECRLEDWPIRLRPWTAL